jgi:hypothetical protein
VLHHALTGKAGAARATGFDRTSFARNSKLLHSWTRGQINVSPALADNNDTLILSCGKCSNGREFAPFAVRLDPETLVYQLDEGFDLEAWQAEMTGRTDNAPLMTPERVRALCAALKAKTKAELAKAIRDDCGCARQVAYKYIKRAESAHFIKWNPKAENYT